MIRPLSMTNPLLEKYVLPPFGRIRPEHAAPAVDTVLADNRAAIAALLAGPRPFTWDSLMAPLEELEDRLHRAWSPVAHLHAVADNDTLRQAYNDCLPRLTEYATELSQNGDLFRAISALAGDAGFGDLDPARRKIIENALLDFRLGGIDLPPAERGRYRELRQRLTALEARFEENLLDASQHWSLHVTDAGRLRGLPESALALAAQQARQRQLDGWLLTLDFPCYLPVIRYADDAGLRREIYTAYVTRASGEGPDAGRWDNSTVMVDILAARRELAALLGFESYAHYALARRMADSPAQVLRFLRDLAARARPVAMKELSELRAFARGQFGVEKLEAWDIPYYSEKLRASLYDFTEEDLRPYFPLPRVLSGMFEIVHRLYGVEVRETSCADTWHGDVRFYTLHDQEGRVRGRIFLDLHARKGKRGGAWMDDCIVRRHNTGVSQDPVAYLVCNFPPPVDGTPSLLSHDDVMTLFHEFGHSLHHVLTRVDYADVAGIRGVPWDAVELPSQFMENWCWDREAIDLLAARHDSGASMPDDLYGKLRRAQYFHSGLQLARQVELSLFDFRLHAEGRGHDTTDIQALLDEVREEVAAIVPPSWNRFQHSFSHIFGGGYAAGYYSYKWAEVLSADAFSVFEENGIFDRASGQRFLHTILEQGGARDPMELFVEFRGREPSIEPLLRRAGISTAEKEASL